MRLPVVAAAAVAALAVQLAGAVDAPVIGILTVPSTSDEPCATLVSLQLADPLQSCVAFFYERWLVAAGARVAYIPYNANHTTLDRIFASINGLLFTGGSQPLWFNTTYLQTAEYLFDKVLAANDAGDYFPLHGTCMGFQSISIIAARNESVLETYAYDSEGISWPLTFTADAPSTRLWGEAPASAMQTFSTVDSTVNLHHDGVPPSAYEENPRLAELLIMTSTNVDRVGKPFVSSWVGRNYPITAVQFHPEKVANQFTPGIGIPHTRDVIEANRYIADFFVADARRSTHEFDVELAPYFAAAAFTPTFVGAPLNNFAAYLFPPSFDALPPSLV